MKSPLMWLKQCHKPQMAGTGLYYATYKNGVWEWLLFYPPIIGGPRGSEAPSVASMPRPRECWHDLSD